MMGAPGVGEATTPRGRGRGGRGRGRGRGFNNGGGYGQGGKDTLNTAADILHLKVMRDDGQCAQTAY